MDGLGLKQREILEFIKKELSLKGYPPSVREICLAVDLKSTATVHSHLSKLEKFGYIRRDPTKPRAIEIIEKEKIDLNAKISSLPVVGRVTAGQPIFAQQNIEEYIPLPTDLAYKGDFILKVQGNSMEKCAILDGDYVIVNKVSSANNGQIVVALVDNESATVKRFFREDNSIVRLQPENDFLEPIILDIERVSIIGIVTGVLRVIK